MKRSFVALIIFLSLFTITLAQTHVQTQKDVQTGSIGGRVVGDNGQPLQDVNVQLVLAGERTSIASRSTVTDENGNFEIGELQFGSYELSAKVSGYVINDAIFSKKRFFRLGDLVNISMAKGGIITGKVTLPNNDPAVTARVTAMRISDLEGNPIAQESGDLVSTLTDDRGIYRIYGLLAGKYVVSAGGRAENIFYVSPYDNDVPVFHPASSRANATAVAVQLGSESSGIDISYRSNTGYSINGKVSLDDESRRNGGVALYLTNSETGVLEAFSFTGARNEFSNFHLSGLTAGEYDLSARFGEGRSLSFAGPKHIVIKNSDINGVDLKLAKLSTIAGRIVQEQDPLANQENGCPQDSFLLSEEIAVSAQPEISPKEAKLPPIVLTRAQTSPTDEQGNFVIFGLNTGIYHLTMQFADETFYINTITQAPAKNLKGPLENYNNGVPVRIGGANANCLVKLTNGAATIQGHIKSETKTPSLVAYLVPFDKRESENALRYYQAPVANNGSFHFGNLAPGKYWLCAEPVETMQLENSSIKPPKSWTPDGRAALRRLAETTNNALELSRCQLVKDLELPYTPTKAAPKAITKKKKA